MPTRTKGATECTRWLEERGLDGTRITHWFVEIRLVANDVAESTFELRIYPEEWAVIVRSGPRISYIRVTVAPFVHDGRDDLNLLPHVHTLDEISDLIAHVEVERRLRFPRFPATVQSNLVRGPSVVRTWLNAMR